MGPPLSTSQVSPKVTVMKPHHPYSVDEIILNEAWKFLFFFCSLILILLLADSHCVSAFALNAFATYSENIRLQLCSQKSGCASTSLKFCYLWVLLISSYFALIEHSLKGTFPFPEKSNWTFCFILINLLQFMPLSFWDTYWSLERETTCDNRDWSFRYS